MCFLRVVTVIAPNYAFIDGGSKASSVLSLVQTTWQSNMIMDYSMKMVLTHLLLVEA